MLAEGKTGVFDSWFVDVCGAPAGHDPSLKTSSEPLG